MGKRPKIAKLIIIIYITIFFAGIASGCGKTAEPKTEQAFALDTIVSVTYYDARDREAVLDALALCRIYERVFSRTDPESELSWLNGAGGGMVSPALREVLTLALEYCAESGGRYDITMGGVSALYDFSGEPHVPEAAALAEALAHVGWEKVRIEGETVTLSDPAAVLDLGSVAKGWIADRMKELLAERGVEHAIISLGGNVLCLGGRPDGTAYKIGIRYPERDSTALAATIATREASVVTSGVYERFFVENGVTYHHLLDPATGGPLETGLLAVSVVGPCSARCDALSTVCFALGAEAGCELIDGLDGYEAVFIRSDGTQVKSAGFAKIEVLP
jgi:thiamine biosynthesis lipoprotein